MQSNPIVYQTFSSKELAIELTNLLSENNIAFKTEVFNATFDSAFTNNSNKDYVVKINPSDFEKVDELLLESMKDEIDNVNDDYYLFQFSDEELFDLIRKRDEWSQFDVLLAKKVLQSRNIEFSPELDNKIKQERFSELAEAKKADKYYILVGYLLAISGIYFGFFISFLGVLIGLHIKTSKKTLSNGKQFFEFTGVDRNKGYQLILVSSICFILSIIIKYTKQYFIHH